MTDGVFRETEHGKRETVFLVKEWKSEGVKEFFQWRKPGRFGKPSRFRIRLRHGFRW